MLTPSQIHHIQWYRQSAVGVAFCIGIPFLAINRMYEEIGVYYPNSILISLNGKDNNLYWYYYFDKRLAWQQVKKILSLIEHSPAIFSLWEKNFFAAGEQMSTLGPAIMRQSIYSPHFGQDYEQFLELAIQFWIYSIFNDLFDPFEHKIPQFIFGNRLADLNKTQLNILLSPEVPSHAQSEQKDLLAIYDLACQTGINSHIQQLLQQHSDKYFWLQNDYLTARYLDAAYFRRELQKLLDHPSSITQITSSLNKFTTSQNDKHTLIHQLTLDKTSITKLHLFNKLIKNRDDRKKYNLICNYYLLRILKKISQETGYEYDILKYLLPDELIHFLQNDPQIISELSRRNGYGLINYLPKPKQREIISGPIVRKYFDLLESNIVASEIKGNPVCHGQAIGAVKIILSPADFSKMKKGDILVTSMTRPEFIPVMHKAAAIVTDEGGLTCHAAIISRELGIPCITGTQVATKTLHDGDLIDVNADHGLIKKIGGSHE